MNKISVIGLDLAKNVFQIHAVDEQGEVVLRKSLRRSRMQPFFAKLPPCLIAMEAYDGAQDGTSVYKALPKGHPCL